MEEDLVLHTIFELTKFDLLGLLQWWGAIGVEGEYRCPNPRCNGLLKLTETVSSAYLDQAFWRCGNSYLNSHKKRVRCATRLSIRTGTFFEKSHLSLKTILAFVRLWMRNSELGFIEEELRISHRTVTDWNSFCQEVAIAFCLDNKRKIGGPGKTVEIDESKFGKRKYHRGHCVEGQWVFGGVCRETGDFFMLPVERRDRETLIPLIQEWVEEGTTIMSDCWKAYDILGEIGFQHLTVNHSIEFKNQETGACTNRIEGMWRHAKHRIPEYRRNKDDYLGYLCRFMFASKCSRQGRDVVVEFMKAAGVLYNAHKLNAVDEPSQETEGDSDSS